MRGVLFDLDGTLVDTAPDLVAALNLALDDFGFSRVSLDSLRAVASHGSLALVKAAQPGLEDAMATQVQQALLMHYGKVNGTEALLFPGMPGLLEHLHSHSIPWGIVTNKAARYARPLLDRLGLAHQCTSLISGDTVTRGKPDAGPMLLGASHLGTNAGHILYLGDARRDMEAARRAGMVSVLAAWGYLSSLDEAHDWPIDIRLMHPEDLIAHL
ncbi:HAD-IA family hydrolase [Shewanella litorisediminis]|uniref:HAD-IA family hydrolase n=2 Tax=Shewanella litorisediminis TaxID=1173586 RepID=A0ABX7G8T9_9GAMM|nr:HAD-IA family hydrolase [Shewanella litorisediminis]